MKRFIFMSLCLLWGHAATYSYAQSWTVYKPLYIPQNHPSYYDVLPAEDMSPSHTITWGGGNNTVEGGGVRFWGPGPPEQTHWGTPQAGDIHCWLYDSPSEVVWWEGAFNVPSTSVSIQLPSCNSNDGWLDIYVDGSWAFDYNAYHSSSTSVMIIGTGLDYIAHEVRIQTRINSGDVHLDYVAAPAVPEPATITLLGLGGLVLLRRHKH